MAAASQWPAMDRPIAHLLPVIAGACLAACSTFGWEKPFAPATPASSPGAVPPELLAPEVSQETAPATICAADYAQRVRAPENVTNPIKLRLLNQNGLGEAQLYRLEQRIPLELGGHPREPRNFVLESWEEEANAKRKLQLASTLRSLVCDRKLGLREAQAAYFVDWRAAYERYVKW